MPERSFRAATPAAQALQLLTRQLGRPEAALPHAILLTGGSGRLGRELQRLLPGLTAPASSKLDVCDAAQAQEAVRSSGAQLVVHAAAFTDVAAAETQRERCWQVNVTGTRNMARAASKAGAFFVHISTDYVFPGHAPTGGYAEDDTPGPALNHYALTKIVAEEAARFAARQLILRTSFRDAVWPHAVAFGDPFTRQDYLAVLAPQLALALLRARDIPYDVLHVAGPRRSALELARLRTPGVKAAAKAEAPVNLPDDISLSSARWHALLTGWTTHEGRAHEGSAHENQGTKETAE
jgi:dTDP-4-dehydrorhamnose reductase